MRIFVADFVSLFKSAVPYDDNLDIGTLPIYMVFDTTRDAWFGPTGFIASTPLSGTSTSDWVETACAGNMGTTEQPGEEFWNNHCRDVWTFTPALAFLPIGFGAAGNAALAGNFAGAFVCGVSDDGDSWSGDTDWENITWGNVDEVSEEEVAEIDWANIDWGNVDDEGEDTGASPTVPIDPDDPSSAGICCQPPASDPVSDPESDGNNASADGDTDPGSTEDASTDDNGSDDADGTGDDDNGSGDTEVSSDETPREGDDGDGAPKPGIDLEEQSRVANYVLNQMSMAAKKWRRRTIMDVLDNPLAPEINVPPLPARLASSGITILEYRQFAIARNQREIAGGPPGRHVVDPVEEQVDFRAGGVAPSIILNVRRTLIDPPPELE